MLSLLCCCLPKLVIKLQGDFYMSYFYIIRELGVYVDLLDPSQLTEKFPWMCTEGISLASFGE